MIIQEIAKKMSKAKSKKNSYISSQDNNTNTLWTISKFVDHHPPITQQQSDSLKAISSRDEND